MIFFVGLLIFLNHFPFNTAKSKDNENVYVDTLVQRYLFVEKQLWDYIYYNSSTTNENDILSNIRSKHNDILTDEYLAEVMSEKYISKFMNYVDFHIFRNVAKESRHLKRLFEMKSEKIEPKSEAYLTLDIMLGVYNHTIKNKLFEVIKKVTEF